MTSVVFGVRQPRPGAALRSADGGRNTAERPGPRRQKTRPAQRCGAGSSCSHHPIGVPERDGAGERPRAGPHRMAVIAALHDPLAVLVADNLADMVPPDDDGTDRRSASVAAVVSPGSSQIVLRTGIAADLRPHVPAAPGPGPPGMGVPGRSITAMMMRMMMRIMRMVTMVRSSFGARTPYANHCNCSYRLTHDCHSSFRGREIAASDREGCCSKKTGRSGPSSSPSHVRKPFRISALRNRTWPECGLEKVISRRGNPN